MAGSANSSPAAVSGNAAFAAIDRCPRRPQTRPTKALGWELASHTKAYLEVQQYAQGYDFLHSLLAAGTSISVPAKTHVGFVAPAVQLALAATLIVYPPITTQTRWIEKIKGAESALRYLRCVQQTLEGPGYTIVRKAFSFPEERNRRRFKADAASPRLDAISDVEQLNGPAANAQSLWQCADDFWHVVGWAFNCSVAYKKRWARWKLWLDVMLDFLEGDWEASVREARNNAQDMESILCSSLIWQYINSQDPNSRTTRRRINRSILATADTHSLAQFHKVWPKELAAPKSQDDAQTSVGNVDFDTGEMGDYGSDGEDTVMQNIEEPDTSLASQSAAASRDGVERLGGADAVRLRQRFVALLASVAREFPLGFANSESFYDTFAEEYKSLPVAVFNVLVSTSLLPPVSQVALNINSLLPVTCGRVMKNIYDPPVQNDFEREILVLVATKSFALNAKVSLLIEQLFLYMMDNDLLEANDHLRDALEQGIKERKSVYGSGRGKKGNADEEEQGKAVLQASSARLLGLYEILAISAGKVPRPRKAVNESSTHFPSFGSSLSSAPDSETEDD